MKSKESYLSEVKSFFEQEGYFIQIKIDNLSASKISQFRKKCRSLDVKVLFVKVNLVQKVFKVFKGTTLILNGLNLKILIDLLNEYDLSENKFYKVKDEALEDYTIDKGKLNLKAGLYLPLFEKYVSLKLTKGFIELMEPFYVLKKGQKVSTDQNKILNLLKKRLKLVKGKALMIFSKNKVYSSQFVEAVFNEELLSVVAKWYKTVGFQAPCKSFVLKKMARLVSSIKDIYQSNL